MSREHKEIKKCRICGNDDFEEIISLGNLAFTGIFPKKKTISVPYGPLTVIKCSEKNRKGCGALQLKHSFDKYKLYGESYGYRSALNVSMVNHLKDISMDIKKILDLKKGDIILDIGSNDGTFLSFFEKDYILIGVDPTALKFIKYYRDDIMVIADFFSKDKVIKLIGKKRPKVITSIAMFYDLEDPVAFAKEINDLLDDDGLWVFEQSYTPNIFKKNGYDTICHEHLLYYSLRDIKLILDKSGFKIVEIKLNNVNGASIRLYAAKSRSSYKSATNKIKAILEYERRIGFYEEPFFKNFREAILRHKEELVGFIENEIKKGKKFFGYGASTKGNVILQFCGINDRHIKYIAEVNEDKFGNYTPGSLIKIISERDARQLRPDYFLVLPWHFKKGIILKEDSYLKSGGKLVFPLPNLEVING